MVKYSYLVALFLAPVYAQPSRPVFHADKDLVMVTFTATDANGQYISGLRASDVRVFEDGVEQSITSFNSATSLADARIKATPDTVFVLFDTSNSMYDGFAQVEDTVAAFIRGLRPGQAVALDSFSRNMTRLAPASTDHQHVISRVTDAAAGEDTALFNAILLGLRDAARVPGRKTLVVFSNGPDNASILCPSDVARVAEDEGIPIYVVSIRTIDAATSEALGLLAASTGGKSYIATSRVQQERAFNDVQEDLRHVYTLTYSPRPNENSGFRQITVRINGVPDSRVRARTGYTPKRAPSPSPTGVAEAHTNAADPAAPFAIEHPGSR